MSAPQAVSSGVPQLDRLLDGLLIGDNVIWHDHAGSLAEVFALNFIKSSREQKKPLIYVSFDRSPKNLVDKLGSLADYPEMIILDCFTAGKGERSEVFTKFYDEQAQRLPFRLEMMDNPRNVAEFADKLYDLHSTLSGDVRLVFESLTGMAELWGGEEAIVEFYSRACPRLYELETIAYWLLEKEAHSSRFKARLGQIAQVVVELSIKRGTTYLTVLKADRRDLENRREPVKYWAKNYNVSFADERGATGNLQLGPRLKQLRGKKGLSQSELARMVGVTPSTISQVESNLIFPSLPALMKMAEVLSVAVASFFTPRGEEDQEVIFHPDQAVTVGFPNLPPSAVNAQLLTPMGYDSRAEPYLIEVQPGQSLGSHFFQHKGEEVGYLISGRLKVKLGDREREMNPGDLMYLTSQMPSGWVNPDRQPARLLWITVR